MKIMFFRSVCLLMAILILGLPFASLAQDEIGEEVAAARAAAERDAVADISGVSQGLWFAFGVLLGPLPILFAALDKPAPEPMRLAGKSPNYIAAYIDFYQKATRTRKVTATGSGCLVGVLAAVLITQQSQ